MPSKKASVYVQVTSDEALEHKMVELFLLRDLFIEKLLDVTQRVKDKLRPLDEESTSETLVLVSQVRSTTLELLEQISIWQKKYTTLRRPVANGGDYMCKLLKSVEFANTLAIKRTFNFQIGRGNIFILPLVNAKSMPPVKVTERIQHDLGLFANPDIEKLRAATVILRHSLPKKLLAEIMPLDYWISNRWVPKLSLCSYFLVEAPTLPVLKKKIPISPPLTSLKPVDPPGGQPAAPSNPLADGRSVGSFPELKRMNSDNSIVSQMSDMSIKSKSSIASNYVAGGLKQKTAVSERSISSDRDETPPPPMGVIRTPFSNSTLAMRNWFMAQLNPGSDIPTVPEEEDDDVSVSSTASINRKKKTTNGINKKGKLSTKQTADIDVSSAINNNKK